MAPQLPAELESLRDRVIADWDLAEKMHKPWRDEADRLYDSYRNFKQWNRAVAEASPRDKDATIRDGQQMWDANLHIPYAFSTIETINAQMLAHRPKILVEPRDEEAMGNVDNMAFLMDAQQERIHYELVLQDIGKDGLITGMGWQKVLWETVERDRKRVVPKMTGGGYTTEVSPGEKQVDDWRALRCEPRDMRWDPYAGNVEDAGFIAQRLWFNERKVRQRVESGVWTLPEGWTLEDLLGLGTEQKTYTETFTNRNQASGLGEWARSGRTPFEVWEYHDGTNVVTLVGRQCPVQIADNPCWGGAYAFQVYRPTTAGNGLMPGIGEIEPLEHLIREMNTLRTQRRWNAALVLQRVLAYRAGAVDPDDVKYGPGMLIPVNGDPRELLYPIDTPDIPASSRFEEERLESNIDRTSGVSDPITGGGTGGGTATEAQLVRAAASTRIQNKARRIEVEIIQTGGEYALELNQQKILTDRIIPIPQAPDPYGPERRWTWRKVQPSELMGKMAIKVEGGSTMAENVAQNRQDALQMANLIGQIPELDRKKAIPWILAKFDIHQPDQWVAPEGPPIPPDFLQKLQDMGTDPQLLQAAIQQWQAEHPQDQAQGPGPNDQADPSLQMAQAVG